MYALFFNLDLFLTRIYGIKQSDQKEVFEEKSLYSSNLSLLISSSAPIPLRSRLAFPPRRRTDLPICMGPAAFKTPQPRTQIDPLDYGKFFASSI
jgi:hypothetical protein